MTKKRFKMSMAALGLLAAFFMVLIAVLLAPTLASAGKDAGGSHHHGGLPDPGALQDASGGGASMFTENWSETSHDHGNAYDAPFCVEDGVTPCADPDAGKAFDGADGNPGDFVGDYAAGDGAHGQDGGSNGDGRYTPNFWGGNPGIGGGPGVGGGNPNNGESGNKPNTEESGNPNEGEDGNKPHTEEPGPQTLLRTDPPSDDDEPFVDPSEDPKDGPKDPPTNPLTPETEVTEIPEPLTVSLFVVGLAGAAGLRRRSRRRA